MANKHAKAKNLRARALVSLVAIIVVVAVCAYLGLCGFGKGTMINYLKPWGDAISLGLDLRGGVYTVYQAENNGDPDFDTKMESTVSILTSRLTRQGFTEATVTRQGSDRIRVEIPNVSDPNQILTIIGTPAQLYFVDESGNNLMEGSMVKNAQAAQDQDGKPCIAFELTDEGAKIFAEATAANLGKTISITLDGETISRATVNTVIAGGKGEITGNFTADEAKNLATLILSGALPLNLAQLEVSAISATLGVEALDRAIQAGIIGVALVMLFMLFRYRLCGLVADIALTIYIMIVVLLLALTGAQLTLPGVAGIILGIGMAVDANVVIFERIREEVKNGRPIGSAVRKGFSNALSAIIDSNVTTIIAAVVLYAFGTGSVRGFALTLGIGVATFSNQNLGAGRRSRIWQSVKAALAIYFVWWVFVMAFTFLLGGAAIRGITGSTDEVIISNALLYLKISAPVIPPMAVLVILRNMLQGIQHTVEPLLASGLELVGKVIFAVWLVPVQGYRAVCFCEPTTWVVCFVFILLAVWRCRGDLRDAEKI